MVDDILLNEAQKASAARKSPYVSDSNCEENNLYQIKEISLEETTEKLG